MAKSHKDSALIRMGRIMFFIIQRNLSSEKKPRLVGIINYGTRVILACMISSCEIRCDYFNSYDIQYGMALVDELFSYITKSIMGKHGIYANDFINTFYRISI